MRETKKGKFVRQKEYFDARRAVKKALKNEVRNAIQTVVKKAKTTSLMEGMKLKTLSIDLSTIKVELELAPNYGTTTHMLDRGHAASGEIKK